MIVTNYLKLVKMLQVMHVQDLFRLSFSYRK